MTPETHELVIWIEHNTPKFKDEKYTIDQIAQLAVACGFNRTAVAEWQTKTKFEMA